MSYDLGHADVRRLTAAALAAHDAIPGRFIALAIGAADPLAAVARTVERQVFEESFGNDAATMTDEYAAYEDDSMFFLVLDRKLGQPAGAARVIDGGGKTFDDAPAAIGRNLSDIVAAHDLQTGRLWDFATIVVLPAYRGGRTALAVSSLLYRTFINAGRQAGVRHMICLLDHRAYRNQVLIGAPFQPLAGSAPFAYLGSKSTRALYLDFPALEPAIAEQSRRLRRPGAKFNGEIRARGLRRLLTRRIAARISAQISSGQGLDDHIVLELPVLTSPAV